MRYTILIAATIASLITLAEYIPAKQNKVILMLPDICPQKHAFMRAKKCILKAKERTRLKDKIFKNTKYWPSISPKESNHLLQLEQNLANADHTGASQLGHG